MQSSLRKLLHTFWTVSLCCFILRSFSFPHGMNLLGKNTYTLRAREVSENEGRHKRKGPVVFYWPWKGRWDREVSTRNVCNFLSPDELRVTSLWPDKVGGGAGRRDQVQMPYSLYFWWLYTSAFLVWPLFIVLKFSILTLVNKVSNFNLFSYEDGDEGKKIPTWALQTFWANPHTGQV